MKRSDTKHQLEVTTPSDRDVLMTRSFDAPRALVFEAFTKPELIRRWLLGPDGWSMPVCDIDFRVGGNLHYVWRNDSDGKQFGLRGIYREIVTNERIAHTENFDEPWYPGDALITTTFTERDGVTIVMMNARYDSKEIRDGALESGMERGVARSFERLSEVLATGTA